MLVVATVPASTIRAQRLRPPLPQQDAADADQRSDRGRQGNGVIRMDDARGQAEDQCGDHQ